MSAEIKKKNNGYSLGNKIHTFLTSSYSKYRPCIYSNYIFSFILKVEKINDILHNDKETQRFSNFKD